jgi:hypothetical protein
MHQNGRVNLIENDRLKNRSIEMGETELKNQQEGDLGSRENSHFNKNNNNNI